MLAPDVNESARDFTVVPEGIRFGLAGVKNVGEGAIEAILEARGAGGTFSSLFDFAARVDGAPGEPARGREPRQVRQLRLAAPEPRRGLGRRSTRRSRRAPATQRDREIGQASLFGDGSAAAPGSRAARGAAWTDRQRLEYEKEVLGFYVTGHPLASVAAKLAPLRRHLSTGQPARRAARCARAGS